MTAPSHHRSDGRFRNPWPEAAGDAALRRKIPRVAREFLFGDHPPDPRPEQLPLGAPDLVAHVPEGEVRITWVGHATALIQLPGLNVLTDPVWSRRCSPLPFAGPARFVPAVPDLESLPRVDVVLLSHDHYDHMDRSTIRALHRRYGADLQWVTPLGYRPWFARQGIHRVETLDWWDDVVLPGGTHRVVAVPARHWTRRNPGGDNRRLWSGFALLPVDGATPGTRRVYFAGDSGYCSAFEEIGRRLGPFDVSLVPVGAYEPRWFMAPAHMNPEEAVRAYRDMGSRGVFVPIHWGTWRLTFEDPLEPPDRTRSAWLDAGLPEGDLRVLRHGGTLTLRDPGGS